MANVKRKDHEKLSDANVSNVIALLEAEKPITKKDACSILNISYNTTRLASIIEEYKSQKELSAKRREQKRGKPADFAEIRTIAEGFLSGEPVSSISKRVYRSPGFINNVVEKIGIPKRATGDDKYNTELLPDACVAEQFDIGEIAWSAKYHAPCEVRARLTDEKYTKLYGGDCYRVYVVEHVEDVPVHFSFVNTGGYNAFVPAYDLGKLNHLKELGVDPTKL